MWADQTNTYVFAVAPILGALIFGLAGLMGLGLWQLLSAPHRLLSEVYEYLQGLETDDVGIAVKKLQNADLLKKFCAVKVYTGREYVDVSSFGRGGVTKLEDFGIVDTKITIVEDNLHRRITWLGREAYKRVCGNGTAE